MCIMDSSGTMETTVTSQEMTHPLYDKWVLWAHLPHDTDWSLKSYKKIMTVTSIEEMVSLYAVIPEKLVKNCRANKGPFFLTLNTYRHREQ